MEQEEKRIRQENLKKEEEERERIQLEKEQLYRKQELLNKDYDEIPHLTGNEIGFGRNTYVYKKRTYCLRKKILSYIHFWITKMVCVKKT